jgi:hypothetical protein
MRNEWQINAKSIKSRLYIYPVKHVLGEMYDDLIKSNPYLV